MATNPAMRLLERHVPITLLCDLLDPPCSQELLYRERDHPDRGVLDPSTLANLALIRPR